MFKLNRFLLAFVFPWMLFSQHEKQISFNQLSINDGLSQNSVVDITQDKTGYLWFATQDGLNKYNGINFEKYSLLFDDITKENYSKLGKVFVTKRNIIFTITKNGILQKLNAETNVFKKLNRFKNVSSIYQTKDSSLWIGTFDNTLYKLTERDTIKFLTNENDLKSIYAITNYKNKVVVASSNVLFFIDQNQKNDITKIKQQQTSFSSFAISNDSLFIGSYGKGLFYTTNYGKLHRFNGFGKNNFIPNDLNILSLLSDSKNRLWIGTYGKGVYLINFLNQTVQHFKTQVRNPKAIHYNDILKIYEDETGTIWFGTDGAGLSYFDENLSKFNVLTNYQTPINTNVNVIRAITEGDNGMIIMGSSGNGLTYYNKGNNSFKTYKAKNDNGILSNRIMSLLYDNNQLWIGYQDKGLSILLKNKKFIHFSKNSKPALDINTIWCILKDSKNRIWFGTRDNGLIQFDVKKGVQKKYIFSENDRNSISENNIRTLIEANDGNLWIGTENSGLNKLIIEKGIFKRYSNLKGIKSLHQTDSILWIGTNGKGLQALNLKTNKIHSYTVKNGLPNSIIYGILEDKNKKLWLSSNQGITQFNFKDFKTTPKIVNYQIHDGLQSLEFNTGAYFKDKKGRLYFGGLKGINWFLPSIINKNNAIPKTEIYEIALFDKKIALNNNQTFKSFENTFSFSFAALHFALPERNKYRYILENYETEWSIISTKNFAHYTNLNAGTYTFKVISSNYDDVWNTTPTTFTFTINPVWYLTFWAKIAYLLSTLFLLFLIYSYLKWRWKMELNLKLEHAEKEKLSSELLQMEMDTLRSRMNPHFIFNSLNSIKSFIISNDVKSSVIYFSKFAKLLRYNLNNSTIHFVSLADEINFLKDYVALENLRLSAPFKFVVEISENLDIESLKVPPLVIQPFIENAIWHGLSLIKKDGLLLLKIVLVNNSLEIHIIDNGIGREASRILNKNKIHTSKGISITEERLEIFSRIYKLDKSFKIIDLKDDDNKNMGTEVIIKLPLLDKHPF